MCAITRRGAMYALTPGEAHVGGERAGLDDEVADRAAVAEDTVPFAQGPIDRGAAVEADIEPLVKPAHQCRCELAPLAAVAHVEQQPAAAAAQRLVFEYGSALALRHRGTGQLVKSAIPVVGEPQRAVLDVEHQTAGNI